MLDASAAVTWVLRDGKPEDENRIDELVSTALVLVPELWHAEMANAFHSAIRAGRIDEEFVICVCEQLDQLDIRTDVVGTQAQRLALEAHARGLTSYDTSFSCSPKIAGCRWRPLIGSWPKLHIRRGSRSLCEFEHGRPLG